MPKAAYKVLGYSGSFHIMRSLRHLTHSLSLLSLEIMLQK